MSEWAPKRFWTETRAIAADDGYTVELDGRRVHTPAKAPLIVPTEALAQAIAAEWDAQVDAVVPASMPATRAANAAIDKVAGQFDEVADMLAAYGDSDLLCYRAEAPDELVALQAGEWDPLLDWAATALGARLVPVTGVMHAPQDPAVLNRLGARLRAFSPFELAAVHDLVTLPGSLIVGLAAAENHLSLDGLWQCATLEERWQEQQWGHDEEAQAAREAKRSAFVAAGRFLALCKPA